MSEERARMMPMMMHDGRSGGWRPGTNSYRHDGTVQGQPKTPRLFSAPVVVARV